MAMRIVRLGDPTSGDAPFRLKKGDRVAWKRSDGSADREFSGIVVDGLCEYVPGGGAYRDSYVVERADGLHFGGGHFDLVPIEEKHS
jgi:hypothetical protein